MIRPLPQTKKHKNPTMNFLALFIVGYWTKKFFPSVLIKIFCRLIGFGYDISIPKPDLWNTLTVHENHWRLWMHSANARQGLLPPDYWREFLKSEKIGKRTNSFYLFCRNVFIKKSATGITNEMTFAKTNYLRYFPFHCVVGTMVVKKLNCTGKNLLLKHRHIILYKRTAYCKNSSQVNNVWLLLDF